MANKQLGAAPVAGVDVARMQEVNYAPSYGSPSTAQKRFDWLHGSYNWVSVNTRIMDQGLANAALAGRPGTGGISRELWIGDSSSAGIINNVNSPVQRDCLGAVPLAMRDQLSYWGVPANGTGHVRCVDDGVGNDPRWSFTGTAPSGQTTYTFVSTTATVLIFTSDRPGTFLDVKYNNTFTGTYAIKVDGVTVGTVVGAGTSGWVIKRIPNISIYAGSVITYQLTTAGTGMGIASNSVWTPNNGLVIDNVSQSGSKAGNTALSSWTDTSNGASPILVWKDSYRTRQVTDAAATGTTTVTSATAAFTQNDVGEPVDFIPDATNGILFPPGTCIQSVTNSTTAILSQVANTTASGKTMNISRDYAVVHIALGANDMQAGRTAAQIVTDIQTIAANFPKSTILIHLQEEVAYSLVSQATQALFQAAIYAMCDTNNWALYDWRDRTGDYTTALAVYEYGDYQAHLTRASQSTIGAMLAMLRGGGTGSPRMYTTPVDDGDLVTKAYVDSITRFKTPTIAVTTLSGTGEKIAFQIPIPSNQLKVGTTVKVDLWGTCTGTTTPTMTTQARIGTAGTTSDTSICTTNSAISITSATGFRAEYVFTVRSIGTSGTIFGFCNVIATATNIQFSNATAAVTVDTTQKQFLSCNLTLGGTTPIASVNISFAEMIHP